MNAIMDKPKTIPCPRCFGRKRVWKTATGEPVHRGYRETEAQQRVRLAWPNLYIARTLPCPACEGSGEIAYPELKS